MDVTDKEHPEDRCQGHDTKEYENDVQEVLAYRAIRYGLIRGNLPPDMIPHSSSLNRLRCCIGNQWRLFDDRLVGQFIHENSPRQPAIENADF